MWRFPRPPTPSTRARTPRRAIRPGLGKKSAPTSARSPNGAKPRIDAALVVLARRLDRFVNQRRAACIGLVDHIEEITRDRDDAEEKVQALDRDQPRDELRRGAKLRGANHDGG